jgi:ABC-2 type transport system permease protein
MSALRAIMRKEVSDHFSSSRFLILFSLIAMVSVLMVYMAGLKIAQDLEGEVKPTFVFLMLFTSSGIGFPLVQFVAFFGPLVGLILGFDSINREWNEGTLSKLLAQPLHRDAVINGKFLAGVLVIGVTLTAIVLVITGLGLVTLGVVPGAEELYRIFFYLLVSLVYVCFWLGMAILFPLAASAAASAAPPLSGESQTGYVMRMAELERTLSLFSPMRMYLESMAVIVDPLRRTASALVAVGRNEDISLSRFAGPLSLDQSLLMVFPQIVFLVAILVLCFAVSYIVFQRREIRSI